MRCGKLQINSDRNADPHDVDEKSARRDRFVWLSEYTNTSRNIAIQPVCQAASHCVT
jgi:hypothetical protein